MKKKSSSEHHITPSSRGGLTEKDNLARIDQHKHSLYHQLFENLTPFEILKLLSNYYWRNENKEDGDNFIAEYYQTVIFAKYYDKKDGKRKNHTRKS